MPKCNNLFLEYVEKVPTIEMVWKIDEIEWDKDKIRLKENI